MSSYESPVKQTQEAVAVIDESIPISTRIKLRFLVKKMFGRVEG